MTLLLAIPNSSLPDKQDGSMCQALTEAIKKRPMSSLTPPATAHVLTAIHAVQRCLGLLHGQRLCRLDGLPLCQSAPILQAQAQAKTSPYQLPLQSTGHRDETELTAENAYSLCHSSWGTTVRTNTLFEPVLFRAWTVDSKCAPRSFQCRRARLLKPDCARFRAVLGGLSDRSFPIPCLLREPHSP